MGAIVAAMSKCDDDVVPLVIIMLEALIHRGIGSHEVITPSGVVSTKSLDELRKKSGILSSVCMGRNMSKNGRHYESIQSKDDDYAIIFEGEVFPQHPTHPFSYAGIYQTCLPLQAAKKVLSNFDGHYTFVVASGRQILLGRDPLGIMPLYYGENRILCAVASERKALWNIGVKDVHSFPPGNLARMNRTGFAFESVSAIRQPRRRKMKLHEAAIHLEKLLAESIRERVLDAEKAGVAFSGGLDSSVIARLAQKCGVAVNLISIGSEGQPELAHAVEAAKALSMPITVKTFKIVDVEKILSKVLWLLEEPDAMKASVAIPFFWAAQTASKLGCRVLLSGQGADELFGGYHKYLAVYAKYGAEKVIEALYDDTVMSHETNFQRDESVSAFHKIDLRLPFADIGTVRFALSLPINLKIESENDGLRKRVLRKVAKDLGIPAFISDRPKKAIQYATGVDRALRHLARSKGLTPSEYVEEVFKTVYPSSRVRRSAHSNLLQSEIS